MTEGQVVLAGGAEAWRLAAELGRANVGVILKPSRSFPLTWDERRMYVFLLFALHNASFVVLTMNNFSLAGPPLTYDTPLTRLLEHNVTVAIGVRDEFAARNTRFDVAWVRFSFT